MKKKKKAKTYFVLGACSNCNYCASETFVEVPYGQQSKKVFSKIKCPGCGVTSEVVPA